MTSDPLVLVLTIVCSILTILLVVVGVQVFIVLQEFKQTLRRANGLLDILHGTALHTLVPLTSLRGMAQGLRGGMRVIETFANYLKRHEAE